MAKKFLFVVHKPPYKSENPKLALTHSLASFLVEMVIDDSVEATVAFVGDGVLNCVRGQNTKFYGITATEQHVKNMLASDMKVLVCREDVERFGIKQERLVSAADMGAETEIKLVAYEEIHKAMEEAQHVFFF